MEIRDEESIMLSFFPSLAVTLDKSSTAFELACRTCSSEGWIRVSDSFLQELNNVGIVRDKKR